MCYHQSYITGSSQGSYSVRRKLTQDRKLDCQNRIKSTGNGKYKKTIFPLNSFKIHKKV